MFFTHAFYNKTDHLDITEILLKVVLSTLNQTNKQSQPYDVYFRTKTDKVVVNPTTMQS
jgi:membrane-anchored protein YejM (alkaline phosphatase superfamily)